MTFQIDADQLPRLRAWMDGQRAKVLAANGGKMPYNIGAIGGVYTYSFTNTSIGQLVTCKNSVTGDKIDLSGDL